MNRKELKAFKEHLLTTRVRLRQDTAALAARALNVASVDCADSSTIRANSYSYVANGTDEASTLRLLEEKDRTLQLIERALEQIEDGTYGTCRVCRKRIARRRLEALPFTSLCGGCVRAMDERRRFGVVRT